MGWFAYIRKGKVYIPSSADTVDGILMGIEPIETVNVADMAALRDAVSAVIGRGRRVIPAPRRDASKNDPVLALAGVRTWSSFYKGTQQLGFMRGESGFEIFGLKPYERGYQTDETTREKLPGDLPLAQVAVRIAERIQQEAGVR